MRTKEIWLLRGVSGSGKTTLASKLAYSLGYKAYAADDYFYNEDGYVFDPTKLHLAHYTCQMKVRQEMMKGKGVIVHNTLTRESEIKPYTDLAEAFGYTVHSLVVEHRHEGVNHHDVPEEAINKMKQRFSVCL